MTSLQRGVHHGGREGIGGGAPRRRQPRRREGDRRKRADDAAKRMPAWKMQILKPICNPRRHAVKAILHLPWLASLLGQSSLHVDAVIVEEDILEGFHNTQYDDDRECWKDGRTRSRCCTFYQDAGCFDGETTSFEKCCVPRKVWGGPAAFHAYLMDDDVLRMNFLIELKKVVQAMPDHRLNGEVPGYPGSADWTWEQRHPERRAEASAAGVYVLQRMKELESHLEREVLNQTIPLVSDYSLAHIYQGYYFFWAFFVALEALGPWISDTVRSYISFREERAWANWAKVWRRVFGYMDYCRCMEGGEFYSHIGNQLRRVAIGEPWFHRSLFDAASLQHSLLLTQQCRETPLEVYAPEAYLAMMLVTGCAPGDIGLTILMLHNCILEEDVPKAWMLYDAAFSMATMIADCHDSDFWPFTPHDVAVQYARAVWEIARRQVGLLEVDTKVLRSLVWSETGKAPAWRTRPIKTFGQSRCRPHDFRAGLRILADHDDNGSLSQDDSILDPVDAKSFHGSTRPENIVVGPLCTELGRYWIRLQALADPFPRKRTLAIIPLTYAEWPNPWHHFHWWVPAIYYLRVAQHLNPEELDIALAFSHKDAKWGQAATSQALAPERTEKSAWSFVWGRFTNEKQGRLERYARAWQPTGLLPGAIRLLSARPARPLQEVRNESYERVIMGLPSVRSTLHEPGMTCSQVEATRLFVDSTRGYKEVAAGSSLGRLQPGSRRVVTFVQRQAKEGRVLSNLPEVIRALQANVQINETAHFQVVSGFSGGWTWMEQYHAVRNSDIFIGVGGAALGWSWALPTNGAVIELRDDESPLWLPCSERWDVDIHEMFGGLARLAGVHHICLRPKFEEHFSDPSMAALSDLRDMKIYERQLDVEMSPTRMIKLMLQALNLLDNGPYLHCG